MCKDVAGGQFVLDPGGKLDLHWSPRASAKRIFELEHAMRAMSRSTPTASRVRYGTGRVESS